MTIKRSTQSGWRNRQPEFFIGGNIVTTQPV